MTPHPQQTNSKDLELARDQKDVLHIFELFKIILKSEFEFTPWDFGAAIIQERPLFAHFHSCSLISTFNPKAT